MSPINTQLEQLAHAYGIMTSYEDVYRIRHSISEESLMAALQVMGVDLTSMDHVPTALAAEQHTKLRRGVEPVLVRWDASPMEFDLTVPIHHTSSKVLCTLEPENGGEEISQSFDLESMARRPSPCGEFATFQLTITDNSTWGYYRLRVHCKENVYESLLISAPRRAFTPDSSSNGDWGCFLPLYATGSERNWGVGDFTDLRNLVDWTAKQGGTVVGTLPLLAAYLDEPFEPSPYAPASRLAWNEFYVDIMAIPELVDCQEAANLLGSDNFLSEIVNLKKSDQVEYRRIMSLKRQVLEMLAKVFFQQRPAQRQLQFEQFLKQHIYVEDYAKFRATLERQRQPWDCWPDTLRDGCLTADDYDLQTMQYHLYAQWIATSQLESLSHAAGGGLYLDLPLGVRPDGYDTYRWRDVYACDASAGSPPDAMWTTGQDWSFPPLHPIKIREQGYRHVRDYLSYHIRLSRMLRIDHVMQLHRLYWIPHGMPIAQGMYVRYHPEEFYAILNLESHRRQTILIGENLGTVPPEVNNAMRDHGFRQMYVFQYEIASFKDDSVDRPNDGDSPAETDHIIKRPNDVPADSLASLNTHDMPTFAAWWQGEDISMRQNLGLLSEEAAARERDKLQKTRSDLTQWLRHEGVLEEADATDSDVLHAILKFLSASDASVVLINMEDLWLETEPQNVPGTGPELPNWKRKAAVSFDQFAQDPDILAILREVARLRRH